MLDLHSHILYGVDDGSESLHSSIAMLKAAKRAGIHTLFATPHWKSNKNDRALIQQRFEELLPYAERQDISLRLGFEYNISALDPTRFEDAHAFALEQTDTLLLEMPFEHWPAEWERIVLKLQKTGLTIVVAHPERYTPIQNDLGILRDLIEIGCLLQCNASSILTHRPERKRVMRYIRQLGRLDFLASDAHSRQDYEIFEHAVKLVAGEINYPSY